MRPSAPTLREWLREGDFALAMSSGFFGFYAHSGALAALEEAGAVPTKCAGSSAGALVTGLRAGGVLPDAIERELTRLRRADFWDPSPGVGLLRGRLFRERLDALLPVRAVEDCTIAYAASVYDLRGLRTRVVAQGSLAAAIHASCALPGLFHPVWIDGRPYSDGGIADRPGVAGVANEPRVLHHHLASRSPWRSVGSASMKMPERAGLVSVALEGITRLGPFALERGREAFRQAERGMREALDRPVTDGVVRVHAR
jgi:NTE family protein